jgi:hypothetical protein
MIAPPHQSFIENRAFVFHRSFFQRLRIIEQFGLLSFILQPHSHLAHVQLAGDQVVEQSGTVLANEGRGNGTVNLRCGYVEEADPKSRSKACTTYGFSESADQNIIWLYLCTSSWNFILQR